jgi:LuxR family transcriptional regulator, maltose regulon positive regulatory protein
MAVFSEGTEKLISDGNQAMERTDWAKAKDCFKKALEIKETPEVLESLGLASWWLDDAGTTIESRENAFQLYRGQGNSRGAARVAISIAYDYFSFRGEYALSNGWSRRAHRLLENLDTIPEHGWIKTWDGSVAIEADHDPAKAYRLAKEAADIAKTLQDFNLLMMSIALQGIALVFEGKVDEGMPMLDEAATAAMTGEISDLETSINVCCYLITACEYVHDYNRAVQWCFNVKRRTDNGTFPLMFSFCQIHYAGVLVWNGDWDEAETVLKKASNNLIDSRPAHASDGLIKLARIYRFRGDFIKAEAFLDKAEQKPFRMLGANLVLLERAALAYDRSEPVTAANLAERYLQNIPEQCRLMLPNGLEILTLAQLELHNLEEAEHSLQRLGNIAEMTGTEPLLALDLYTRGMVHLAKKEYKQACSCFERSVELFDRNTNPFQTARSRCGMAMALYRLERNQPALREIHAAIKAFKNLKALPEQQHANTILKKIKSLSVEHADSPSPEAFTAREQEILCEIAHGKSNSQIASDHFISIRTVERHISNIYGKLGISGKSARAQATAFAHRNELVQ